MKVLKIRRGMRGFNDWLYSSEVTFTGRDKWDYPWIKRNFGISLLPGQSKRVKIEVLK